MKYYLKELIPGTDKNGHMTCGKYCLEWSLDEKLCSYFFYPKEIVPILLNLIPGSKAENIEECGKVDKSYKDHPMLKTHILISTEQESPGYFYYPELKEAQAFYREYNYTCRGISLLDTELYWIIRNWSYDDSQAHFQKYSHLYKDKAIQTFPAKINQIMNLAIQSSLPDSPDQPENP